VTLDRSFSTQVASPSSGGQSHNPTLQRRYGNLLPTGIELPELVLERVVRLKEAPGTEKSPFVTVSSRQLICTTSPPSPPVHSSPNLGRNPHCWPLPSWPHRLPIHKQSSLQTTGTRLLLDASRLGGRRAVREKISTASRISGRRTDRLKAAAGNRDSPPVFRLVHRHYSRHAASTYGYCTVRGAWESAPGLVRRRWDLQ